MSECIFMCEVPVIRRNDTQFRCINIRRVNSLVYDACFLGSFGGTFGITQSL